jgi:hypothetical protein
VCKMTQLKSLLSSRKRKILGWIIIVIGWIICILGMIALTIISLSMERGVWSILVMILGSLLLGLVTIVVIWAGERLGDIKTKPREGWPDDWLD